MLEARNVADKLHIGRHMKFVRKNRREEFRSQSEAEWLRLKMVRISNSQSSTNACAIALGMAWVQGRGVGTQIKVFCCNNYIIVLSVCPNVTEFVIIFSLRTAIVSGSLSFRSCPLHTLPSTGYRYIICRFVSAGAAVDIADTIPPPPPAPFASANRKEKISAECVNTFMEINNGTGCSRSSLYSSVEIFKTVCDAIHSEKCVVSLANARNGNGVFVCVFVF